MLNGNDTISIYIRSTSSPYSILDSGKSVLHSSSLSSYPELSDLNDGNYYVSIKQRNSIEIWSKDPVDFTVPGDKIFDFKANADGVLGNNETAVDNNPIHYAMYSGDVDYDGSINLTDVIMIKNDAASFTAGYNVTDLTGDNVTNLTDVILAFNNSSIFVNVIKP